MLKNLLVTTAFATMISGAAIAQETPAPAPAEPTPMVQPVPKADGYLATNIIGEGVFNGPGEDAQDVGKVTDIVLDKDGKMEGLVVGVGGFLGLGQKNVMIPYSEAQWAEKDGDRWLVVSMTKEQMQAAPEFDSAPYMPAAPMPTASTPEPVPPAATTPTEPRLPDAGTEQPATPAPTTPAPAQ